MRLLAAIGFKGAIPGGLVLLPDGETVVYALGSTVCVRPTDCLSSQKFLRGHTDKARNQLLSISVRVAAFCVDFLPGGIEVWTLSRVGASDAHGLRRRHHPMGPRELDAPAPPGAT